MVPAERDVTAWPEWGIEGQGQAGNVWLVAPDDVRWLWKPRRTQKDRARGPFPCGNDWAEVIASAAASTLGLPAADAECARRGQAVGVISRDITGGRRLVSGNDLLFALDPSYPVGKLHEVPGYRLDRITAALVAAGVGPPPCRDTAGQSAASVFAGYLVLDAWIANQDRHHQNWGVLEDQTGAGAPVLAPSFDHGSSLGWSLHDDEKDARLAAGTIVDWVRRGTCRPMEGGPPLVSLAREAVARAGDAGRHWLVRLAHVAPEEERSLLDRVPATRMSLVSRRFAAAVLTANRERLLDGI